MTDEYVHGKVQEALERQARERERREEVKALEELAKLPDDREEKTK